MERYFALPAAAQGTRRTVLKSMGGLAAGTLPAFADSPRKVQGWMVPQEWNKQRTGPMISLGKPGDFDDTHIFAPMVAKEGGQYFLWYPGSRGIARHRRGPYLPAWASHQQRRCSL